VQALGAPEGRSPRRDREATEGVGEGDGVDVVAHGPQAREGDGAAGGGAQGRGVAEVGGHPLFAGALGMAEGGQKQQPESQGQRGSRGGGAGEGSTGRRGVVASAAIVVLAGILQTMRPKQWVKNLFVLAPVVFAKNLFHEPILLRAAAAFAGFSMLAGAVYTINDLVDVEDDRRHPTKCHRPIAAGKVPEGVARLAAGLLVLVGVGGTLWLDVRVGLAALAYLALNLAYSFKLKQFAYLDVGIIAVGFVLRVVAGSYAVSTPAQPVRPSLYLLLCTAFLSLFLGFGKRYHELSVNAAKARDALRFYSLPHPAPRPLGHRPRHGGRLPRLDAATRRRFCSLPRATSGPPRPSCWWASAASSSSSGRPRASRPPTPCSATCPSCSPS
jgi:hypothetical protein